MRLFTVSMGENETLLSLPPVSGIAQHTLAQPCKKQPQASNIFHSKKIMLESNDQAPFARLGCHLDSLRISLQLFFCDIAKP